MTAPPRVDGALTKAQRLERLAGALLLSSALWTSFLLPPRRPLPLDACLLHRLTGLPCPTCGLTRAVCLFAQGQWRDSLGMHPAGWLIFLLVLGAVLWTSAYAYLPTVALTLVFLHLAWTALARPVRPHLPMALGALALAASLFPASRIGRYAVPTVLAEE